MLLREASQHLPKRRKLVRSVLSLLFVSLHLVGIERSVRGQAYTTVVSVVIFTSAPQQKCRIQNGTHMSIGKYPSWMAPSFRPLFD
ncbi:hypothetical protein PsorP6_016462 [Peronosclerospora sorghi]|uniref:Uncharacterized protein n=1 Tax=Peronosclerospora sorghi TaxID=230839 RepID=A0ACC0VQ31_9STRA|nr:hypothetical protein PsorP6_016462 [Peronosclerospora sorghi]